MARKCMARLGVKRGLLAEVDSIGEIKERIYEIIDRLNKELLVDENGNPKSIIAEMPLKACNAIATLAGVYARLHETGTIEIRLQAIEAAMEQQGMQLNGSAKNGNGLYEIRKAH